MDHEMRITYVEFAVETGHLDEAVNALSRLGWEVRVLEGHARLAETEADETAIEVKAILPEGDRSLLDGAGDELVGAGLVFRRLGTGIRFVGGGWLNVLVDGAAHVPPLQISARGERMAQLEAAAARIGVDITPLSIDPANDPFRSESWGQS